MTEEVHSKFAIPVFLMSFVPAARLASALMPAEY